MDFLLGILSSIIGNLLTPDLKKWMGLKPPLASDLEDPNIKDLDNPDDAALEQRREYLRRKREIFGWTIMVYFVLFL